MTLPCRHIWLLPTLDLSQKTSSFYISKYSPTGGTGYVLEVDLDYTRELHALHSDYPLATEKLRITREKLSPYSESLVGERFTAQEKLSPNLYDKTKYVTHYENLKFYLEAGMKLKKVHRIMSFTQSDWIRPYIDFSTPRRDVKQRHLFFRPSSKT